MSNAKALKATATATKGAEKKLSLAREMGEERL